MVQCLVACVVEVWYQNQADSASSAHPPSSSPHDFCKRGLARQAFNGPLFVGKGKRGYTDINDDSQSTMKNE